MNFKNSYATLDSRLYHRQPPTPLDNPRTGHLNPIVAKQIGWDGDDNLMENWVDILAGKQVPEGFDPLAMAYAGHQFGQWAGQLGDGRGLLMAQVLDNNGNLTDLHLKGVGLTPYSRMGDGRAVLRSTIREYLCGHAMSSLGIPSSNALGFITSDTKVRRETMEQGAALMRVADSHIRLGHIEWVAAFAPDLLANFTNYMIDAYYPSLRASANPILDFISQVVQRTAIMIANWQLVGFAHGVMNTDNLSITGSTIDYGPFGFMERFNPAWINNHSDYSGRYAYQNQPAIGHWNLSIWAMHFLRLTDSSSSNSFSSRNSSSNDAHINVERISRDSINKRLAEYERTFMTHYQQGICKKLGLPWSQPAQNDEKIDKSGNAPEGLDVDTVNTTLSLAFEFLEIIEQNKLDYTNSFRSLIAVVDNAAIVDNTVVNGEDNTYESELLHTLHQELDSDALQRFKDWQANYISHVDSQIKAGHIADSTNVIATLKANNPVYVLRNAMAQKAIEQANANDFSEVNRLFDLLATPFTVQNIATPADITPPAKDSAPIVVSCSS